MNNIRLYRSHRPKIAKTAFIDPSAVIIGDVTIGEYASVWPGVVIRGDFQPITIGDYTNIQDNATLHIMSGHPLTIGNYVTIGHNAIVHCSKVGDNTLIGMGALLMGMTEIGSNSVIGAGSLVTEHKKLPHDSLCYGNPIKVIRSLDDSEIEALKETAVRYAREAQVYKLDLEKEMSEQTHI